jgi:hypothetical protein
MSVRGSEFSAGRSRKGSTQPTPDDETIPATVDRSGDRVRQEMDADPQSAPDQERSASKARSSRRDRRQEVRREDPPAPSIRRRHK